MPKANNKTQHAKLSPEFMARLRRLKNEQKIRAIVLLRTEESRMPPAYARTRGNRQATIKAIRKSGEQALPDIDRILARFNGKRLAAKPDALGSIPVETTAAGVNALAASAHVKAILEDQAVSLIR